MELPLLFDSAVANDNYDDNVSVIVDIIDNN